MENKKRALGWSRMIAEVHLCYKITKLYLFCFVFLTKYEVA